RRRPWTCDAGTDLRQSCVKLRWTTEDGRQTTNEPGLPDEPSPMTSVLVAVIWPALGHLRSVLSCLSSIVCSPQCVQIPPISRTGDLGVKPAARAAALSVEATSGEDASPTAPQRSQ